jgi:hypothetical protein
VFCISFLKLQPTIREGFEVQERLTCVSFGYKILVPLSGIGMLLLRKSKIITLGFLRFTVSQYTLWILAATEILRCIFVQQLTFALYMV